MGTFTGRIICAALLVLLGMTACSATRSLLFPYHGGYGGGFGGGFPGFGGGYGGFGGGFPGFGGGYGGFGGGYPGFGGGFGSVRKDMKVGAGAGSVNEHEEKTGGFHADGKQNIEKGHAYGVDNAVNGEGAEKGPDGVAEGLGFGTRGHEESGFGEVIGYNEGGEKGGYGGTAFGIPGFYGTGFGEGSGHKSVAVKPGTTP